MRNVICIILMSVFLQANAQRNPETPQIFEKGIISLGGYESHPAFSPSGDTLYMIKTTADLQVSGIFVAYKRNNGWSEPTICPFSGKYMDADPFVARDGQTIYFMSNRPIKGGDSVKNDTDIWKVELKGKSWGEPIRLDSMVNSSADEYYPTIADNGNLYFGSTRTGGSGGSDIYRCRWIKGKYEVAENLGESINTSGNDFEAFIAPDESYLIYNSTPNTLNHLDFFVSYNIDSHWTKAIKLAEPLNSNAIEWSPKITRDGKLFYFSSTRNTSNAVPSRPESTADFNRRLNSAGNGLGDIYTVPATFLKLKLP